MCTHTPDSSVSSARWPSATCLPERHDAIAQERFKAVADLPAEARPALDKPVAVLIGPPVTRYGGGRDGRIDLARVAHV
jgi:hypothetical protein